MRTIPCPNCINELNVTEAQLGTEVLCIECGSYFLAGVSEERPNRNITAAASPRRPPPPPALNDDDDDDFYDASERRASRHFPIRRDCLPHRGQAILILGIISIVLSSFVFGMGIFTAIPAWYMGTVDLRKMNAGLMDPSGRANTNSGRIMGMVITILSLVLCLPFGFIVVLANIDH